MSPQFSNVSPTKKKNSFKIGQIYRKDAQCSETDFLFLEFFCPFFSFGDMVDFVLYIRSVVKMYRCGTYRDFCEADSKTLTSDASEPVA